MKNIHTNSGLSFVQIDNESILYSAEKSEINLPYSCRTGRCSSCKCKLISGETECMSEELGLSSEQKTNGWILTCVRRATTDLHIEIDDLGPAIVKPKILPSKISELKLLSKDVMRVILRLPPNNKLEYYPGQYIDVTGPDGTRRSYSIANSPIVSNHLELHIKRVSGGAMSQYWFDRALLNDLLRVHGALGTFFLRDIAGCDLVFFATGTGMAPIKAMMEGLHGRPKSEWPKSISVYWGAREFSDFYMDLPDFDYPFSFTHVLSKPTLEWLGETGYVQDVFISEQPKLSRTKVYACGSPDMIQSASSLLIKHGLPEKYFYADAFVESGNF
jgi:CDP-4-dehydro-6-deoxyglucose reductase